MRVVQISKHGGPEVLTQSTRDIPKPDYGQILIQNHYAGVNRPDCLQRAGLYNPPKGASDLLGLESAGIVSAVGDGVVNWSVGDAVCALLPGGGYAEYSLTHASHALPIPKGMEMSAAGALPETFFTVWFNLFIEAGLQVGETLLVHGGTCGFGPTLILIVKSLGVSVISNAGSDGT